MSFLKYFLFGASLVLPMNTATLAAAMDMSKFTCVQLLSGGPDAMEAAIWLSGYYNGLRKNTTLDLAALKQNAGAVIAACKANSDKTVMQTVDTLLAGAEKK